MSNGVGRARGRARCSYTQLQMDAIGSERIGADLSLSLSRCSGRREGELCVGRTFTEGMEWKRRKKMEENAWRHWQHGDWGV